MEYVIIGGSIAGISAAKAIRSRQASAEIIMVSGEKAKLYYRPLIPFLIDGKKGKDDLAFPEDPLDKYKINAISAYVTGIDLKTKEVLLLPDKKIKFARLLIATGSSPLIPNIQNVRSEGVFVLTRLSSLPP